MAPLLLLPFFFISSVSCINSHTIYWNTSNPIFRIDNTDHIIDVNHGNAKFDYDQLDIICPLTPHEKHVVYSVSKEEYDSCHIFSTWKHRPKIVALCDGSQIPRHFTITFRPFSPVPGGLEFRPGQDYYFISTSGEGNLKNKVGGYCYTNHMKVVFKVAENKSRLLEAMAPSHKLMPSQHRMRQNQYQRPNYYMHHDTDYSYESLQAKEMENQRAMYERFFKNFSPFFRASYRQSY